MFDAVIIGGGAAGLACAIVAGRRGKSVCVLERNADVGKKILATGNGRCNLSNLDLGPKNFHGAAPDFVEPALAAFTESDLVDFFASLGVPLTSLDDGRVFPHSLQAKTVQRALKQAVLDSGGEIITEAYCKHAEQDESGFTATLFDNRRVRGRALVLAAGGASLKKSGSDGNGYALVERFSHTVKEPFPGIVALTLKGRIHKALDGVKIPSRLTLTADGQKLREDHGDILFTAYGLSGPPVLQQSRHVLKLLKEDRKPELFVNLLLDDWMHTDRFYAFLKARPGTVRDTLDLLLHDRIPEPFLKDVGIRGEADLSSLKHKDMQRLIGSLRGWRFEPDGSRPLEHAQVTCGGVDTLEVDPMTLGSRIADGLYLIGEILDVDGDCGGYNLHWAFATGTLCAKAL